MASKNSTKTGQRQTVVANRASGLSSADKRWLTNQGKTIRDFLKSRPRMSLTDRWKLGNKSKELLKQAARRQILFSAKQLATNLSQPNDANLRQAIKFADRATELQASALQRAGVPWRGVVYWLGIESSKDFKDLRQRMIAGLTNSTDIRDHIANRYKKSAAPRKVPDLAKMAQKTKKQAKVLTATLEAFGDVCQRSDIPTSAAKRKKMRTELQQLKQALEETSGLIRSTRAKIRKRA